LDAFDELRATARAHHVHFDVRPELHVVGDLWMKVGFEVRVWAVHDKGAHAMPGCIKCHDLLAQLERIVQWVLPSELRPTRIELEPSGAILHDSREVPGTDEVAITIRLVHREAYATPVDPCEERCLHQIRERLKLLGIPER
jgi:hypothetical protein